jgi:AcrR family transcriptional regulator
MLIYLERGIDMSKENEDTNYELILNAFVSLLIRVGYQATTINKIAETANVNPSTVFRKFKDKEGLLNVVIDRHLQDLSTIFDDFTATGNIENDLVTMSKYIKSFKLATKKLSLLVFKNHLNDQILQKLWKIYQLNLKLFCWPILTI